MNQVIPMRTGKKDINGSNIDEFDRVSLTYQGKTVTGTVVNVCDLWYPEFSVLIDNPNPKSVYVPLNDNEVSLLSPTSPLFRIHDSDDEFMKYCEKHDWRGMYKNNM